MTSLEIWPALDILDGQAVRLIRGDYRHATVYSREPLAFLRDRFQGWPPRLHLVDLSGAREGTYSLWPLLEQLAQAGVAVEVGGGFRTLEHIRQALDVGAARVVVGTQALIDERFAEQALQVAQSAQRIVASLDVLHGRARIRGWSEPGPEAQSAWLRLYAIGYRLVNITNIDQDGTLAGLDPIFWQQWARVPGSVGAGGGVARLDDLQLLRNWGVPRVVVGKAWLEGQIPLEVIRTC
jgi:phosphoribosylformimino-5-aminoimidazole carboxamide ribotide isomerase